MLCQLKTMTFSLGALGFILLSGCNNAVTSEPASPIWLSDNSIPDDLALTSVYAKVEKFIIRTEHPMAKYLDNPCTFYYVTFLLMHYDQDSKQVPWELPISFFANKEDYCRAHFVGNVRFRSSERKKLGSNLGNSHKDYSYIAYGSLNVLARVTPEVSGMVHFSCAIVNGNTNIIFSESVELNKVYLIWENNHIVLGDTMLSLNTATKLMNNNVPVLCEQCELFDLGKIKYEDWILQDHGKCIRTKLVGLSILTEKEP